MKNTIKALSKQFFGAKYESAGKSLLAAAILFIAIYAAEIRVVVAPAILYLTSTLFTAGVMWQVLDRDGGIWRPCRECLCFPLITAVLSFPM